MGKLKSAAIIGLGISGTIAFAKVLKAILGDNSKPTLYIDFDGTICKDKFPDAGSPQAYVRESLNKLSKEYSICIHSCRTSPHWKKIFSDYNPKEQQSFIKNYMKTHRLYYDSIEMRLKPPGIYIGDECIEYNANWKQISKRLLK